MTETPHAMLARPHGTDVSNHVRGLRIVAPVVRRNVQRDLERLRDALG